MEIFLAFTDNTVEEKNEHFKFEYIINVTNIVSKAGNSIHKNL